MSRPPARRGRSTAGVVLALLVLLGGCGTPAVALPPTPSGVLTADGARVSLSAWEPCGDGARCASVSVPLDWSQPSGDRISVGLALRPADDQAHKLGTVLFNPGGPGGQGAADVAGAGAPGFPGGLGDRFDVVGLDQRGVGSSVPQVRCPVAPVDPTLSTTPSDQAGLDALVAHDRAVAAGCRAATGPLLDHVDSRSAAHDVEAVRVVLGLDSVRWLGLSYGTLLGLAYAELHPDRVASMVLDGPVDHAVGAAGLTDAEDRSTQTALARFAAWCDTADECPLDDAAAQYRQVLAEADAGPLPTGLDPAGITAEQVGRATFGYLQDPSQWPALGTAIAEALGGDAAGFAPDPAGGPQPDPAQAVTDPLDPEDGVAPTAAAAYRAVVCQDLPSDLTDLADVRDRLAALTAAAPDVRGQVEGWGVETGCLGWPGDPAYPPQDSGPVSPATPVLVVAGDADPTTPLSLAPALVDRVRGAVVLPTGVDGHTAYFSGDDCVADAVVAHLTDPGTPPPAACPGGG
ncbi:alpha/beta hydrolase [Rhodococcus aerolatus]